jgi:hypothetical protein
MQQCLRQSGVLLSREASVLETQTQTRMSLESDLCFEERTNDNTVENDIEDSGSILMGNLRGLEYFYKEVEK